MAEKVDEITKKQPLDAVDMQRRLDMLDKRLDNIDSVVTALVERVMAQPVSINLVCPHCGKAVEFSFIGKPRIKG